MNRKGKEKEKVVEEKAKEEVEEEVITRRGKAEEKVTPQEMVIGLARVVAK